MLQTHLYAPPISNMRSFERVDIRDLETRPPARPASYWLSGRRVADLLREQGVKPIAKIEELKADSWPDDESIEDFLAAVRRWREEGS